MKLREVDPADRPAYDGWFGTVRAALEHDWPDDPGELEWIRGATTAPEVGMRHILLTACNDDGTALGSALVRLNDREDRQVARVMIHVDPARRRQGYGRALLEHAQQTALRDGRDTIVGMQLQSRYAATPVPGQFFAEAMGAEAAFHKISLELALPTNEVRLRELEGALSPLAAGYRLITWQGRCPDRFVDGWLALARSMSVDDPTGSLDKEEAVWDSARLRGYERSVREAGQLLLVFAAVHEPTGELAAMTELGVPTSDPTTVYQRDTIALRPHRGHRLGTLTKIANLRQLAERAPSATRVVTWNAVENAPMIRVNEALGFAVGGRATYWKKSLVASAESAMRLPSSAS